jgi:hypothetical protein
MQTLKGASLQITEHGTASKTAIGPPRLHTNEQQKSRFTLIIYRKFNFVKRY